MHPDRIAALLEPFLDRPLSPAQLDQISMYIDLLLRWNARINLTAIRAPEEIVPRHFGESLFLARHVFPEASLRTEGPPNTTGVVESHPSAIKPAPEGRATLAQRFSAGSAPGTGASPGGTTHWPHRAPANSTRVLDLGSGAGFPALPIKIWAPHIHLTLIESNHKKAAFLREAARALTLTDVDVIAERAESLAARLPGAPSVDRLISELVKTSKIEPPLADVVTFRAVEKFSQILPLAIRFLAPHARLAVLISTPQLKELQHIPTMTWEPIHIPESQHRVLVLGSLQNRTEVDSGGD